jgi:alpha-beta hydrolase superfamily lysophospholipase
VEESHDALETVPKCPGSYARWSRQPVGDLIVFVHGFNGTAVETWSGFDDLLPRDPRAAGIDLFFYAWDSLRYQIKSAAHRLTQVLETISSNNSTRRRRRILICAHSLGGLVTRIALIDAVLEARPWVGSVGQALFAPAHLGLAPGVLPTIASSIFVSLAALERDGVLLAELRHRTTLAAEEVSSVLVPKVIAQAEHDRWVIVGSYDNDPRCTFVRGSDHVSLCKPTVEYTTPIELVFEALFQLPNAGS